MTSERIEDCQALLEMADQNEHHLGDITQLKREIIQAALDSYGLQLPEQPPQQPGSEAPNQLSPLPGGHSQSGTPSSNRQSSSNLPCNHSFHTATEFCEGKSEQVEARPAQEAAADA